MRFQFECFKKSELVKYVGCVNIQSTLKKAARRDSIDPRADYRRVRDPTSQGQHYKEGEWQGLDSQKKEQP